MSTLWNYIRTKRACRRTLCLLAAAAPLCGCATTKQPVRPGMPQPSMLDKVGASMKSGSSKMVAWISPKKSPVTEPSAPIKAGPNVFVAIAQLHESKGNLDEAEVQYRKALELDSKHLGALLGYAHLEDTRGNLEAAAKLYEKAAKKHPKDATAHNDLGLCYHRRGMLDQAEKQLEWAVELDPTQKLHRNNLAALNVEQGKNKEALAQLTTAHGHAIGNYNMGYLLVQKQKNAEALAHFRRAADLDASLVPAQQWATKLTRDLYNPSGPMLADTRGVAVPQSAVPNAAVPGAENPFLRASATDAQNTSRLPTVLR